MAVITDKIIPTPEKSPQGRATALGVFSDVMQHPLGTQRGESFGMPMNYVIPPADIYVVNHSRTREYKHVLVAVSTRSGAEEAMQKDKDLRTRYNADMIYREVEKGRDMNVYRFGLKPVTFGLRIPGGRVVPILPAATAEDKPVAVKVPEGTWDLYLGNYDRMRGFDRMRGKEENVTPDPRIIGEEKTRLAFSWRQRRNPVFAYTDDGETFQIENPFGFIEFIRVPVRMVTEAVDKEYLTSLDLVEA